MIEFKKSKQKKEARGIGGFMSGVLVLSLSTVIVKIIGLAVKIPLLDTLGAVGMGYFNSAYEIYALLCVISTAGLPVALSMLISANRERGDGRAVRRVYRSALGMFLVLGAVGSGVMLIFSEQIASIVGNAEARLCIMAISPALFFICFSSAVRGYFQGYENMTPTAVSQLIEALGKLLFGVGFGVMALKLGAELPLAAAMSVLGLTLGIFISSIYLFIVKATQNHRDVSDINNRLDNRFGNGLGQSGTLSTLLRIAVPITLSSAVLSLCRIIDMALILRRLQSAGMSPTEANAVYGSYTTLAVPVFSLVPSLITPISLSLVPRLSAAIEAGDNDAEAEVADRAQRLTVLLSIPASMGIALYAKPILSLLFSGQDEAVEVASPLLAILGASVVFSGLITTTNAILQSYRQTVRPIVSMAVGSVIKIILAYVLIGIPDVGVYGAPVSTLVCNITVTVINLIFIGKRLPKSKNNSGIGQTYMRPLAASLVAIAASFGVYLGMLNAVKDIRIAFVVALPVAVVAYICLALMFGAVSVSDIADIPVGRKALEIIEKIRNKKDKISQKYKEG
ncbi:MAG: polysaccharide biosynthesis protein [Clostridia bacterium]|nr:polysaccharide biosynthesis protein [Clostridia bacterium]